MKFSARLTPRPVVLDAAAKEAILRARVLRCPRCGEMLDGAGPAETCAACRLPLAAVFDPGRLLLADLQCLRVIQRSALVGIVGNAAILAGQVVEWGSPLGQAGTLLLALGYMGLALVMVYLILGLALFGQWWSMRVIAAALLLALTFRVATVIVPNPSAIAITIEMQDIVRLNAAITLPLCVSMMAVGRLLGSPGVVAGFLTAGVMALIRRLGRRSTFEFTWHLRWVGTFSMSAWCDSCSLCRLLRRFGPSLCLRGVGVRLTGCLGAGVAFIECRHGGP